MKFSSIAFSAAVLIAASSVSAIPNCDVACKDSKAGFQTCSNKCALCIPAINAGWFNDNGTANDCWNACHGDQGCHDHCKQAQASCCSVFGCCPFQAQYLCA